MVPIAGAPAGSAVTCSAEPPAAYGASRHDAATAIHPHRADFDACRIGCLFQFNIELAAVSESAACISGCALVRTGGPAFCACACVATNNQIGFAACRAGCEIGASVIDPAGAPASPTTTVATTGTAAARTTSTGVCTDDNAAASQFFAALLGQSLSCQELRAAGGCTDPQFASFSAAACPATCGRCSASTSTTSTTTTTSTAAAPRTDAPVPATPTAGIVAAACVAVAVLAGVAAVLRRQRRRGRAGIARPDTPDAAPVWTELPQLLAFRASIDEAESMS